MARTNKTKRSAQPVSKHSATKAANKAAATKAAIKAAATKAANKAAANKAANKAAATKAANKAAANKAAANKAAATKAAAGMRAPARAAERPAASREASAGASSDWRADLRHAVEEAGPDFAAFLAELGASSKGWEHADTAELAGLERWGTELAKRDRRAGIGALVLAARHGLPIVLERGGIGLDGMGFKADEPSADGAPVEKQIQLAAEWLDGPDDRHLAAVHAACDPSRQLQIWDDDLRPNDDNAHWWYADVGQCCGYAITRTGGDPAKHSYYEWPSETCVGRGLVLAVRGLRTKGASLHDVLADLRAALVAGPLT
ncbi:MAG: hypothetical protein JNL83_39300 [Myxococcales bacterium]|nr:hypothetical protein [Myxococcales bacterium]